MSERDGPLEGRDLPSDFIELEVEFGPVKIKYKGKDEYAGKYFDQVLSSAQQLPILLQVVEGAASPVDNLSGDKESHDLLESNVYPSAQKDENAFDSETDLVENPIDHLANEIGVSTEQLIWACSPSVDPPFIRLDEKLWKSYRQASPSGRASIPKSVTVLTLLVLWKDAAGLGAATVKEGADVLATIEERDRNVPRSLANSEWLREQRGEVQIHPHRRYMAVAVAKAYCLGEAPNFSEQEVQE